MGYKRKELHFPRVIEVWEYHDARYGAPGAKRQKRRKPTREEMRRQNQRTRERRTRWMLRENFEEADCFVTLTYRQTSRPENMDQAAKDWELCRRRIKSIYRKAGVEFMWMSNIEVGCRGAWHIHAVLKNVPGLIEALQKHWGKPHGGVLIKPMWSEGEFAQLAAYLVKTPETDKRLVDAKASHSRNLMIPEPKERKYSRWRTFDQAAPRQIPKGWRVDKESLVEGITKMGYPYRHYDLYPIGEPGERKRQKMVSPGKVIDIED